MTASLNPSTILIEWVAPSQTNGGLIQGYKVYIDNGKGGPYSVVLNSIGKPNLLKFLAGVESPLECGLLYMVKVTALNSAGEGSHIQSSIYLGVKPENPETPNLLSIAPNDNVKISWQIPKSTGCLPLLYYIVQKDGSDLALQIDPSATSFEDDI